jgi:hypothetical protein
MAIFTRRAVTVDEFTCDQCGQMKASERLTADFANLPDEWALLRCEYGGLWPDGAPAVVLLCPSCRNRFLDWSGH